MRIHIQKIIRLVIKAILYFKGLSSYRAREVVIKQTIISCGKEF